MGGRQCCTDSSGCVPEPSPWSIPVAEPVSRGQSPALWALGRQQCRVWERWGPRKWACWVPSHGRGSEGGNPVALATQWPPAPTKSLAASASPQARAQGCSVVILSAWDTSRCLMLQAGGAPSRVLWADLWVLFLHPHPPQGRPVALGHCGTCWDPGIFTLEVPRGLLTRSEAPGTQRPPQKGPKTQPSSEGH